jgi:hypothetical protein
MYHSFTKIVFSAALVLGSSLILTSCSKSTETPPKVSKSPDSKLISNPKIGKPFTTGTINDFTLASDGESVIALMVNNKEGKVYAIDLHDKNASSANENAIASPVGDLKNKIATAMGTTGDKITIDNLEVNPISKSIYVMARVNASSDAQIVKITKAGTQIELLNLEDVMYSAMQFSTIGEVVNDITYGDGALYLSYSHASTLVGKVTMQKAPFTTSSLGSRSTTVFKTNWGASFFTDAPLESMCYGKVAGKSRLMGVTVCAPGYSFETKDINEGTGLLQVNEYFNLNTGSPIKVMSLKQGNTSYLLELHWDGRIVRIGEKYIDGSASSFNANAKYILANGGSKVANGMTDEDVKIIAAAGTYNMMANYSENSILVMNKSGELSLLNL